MIQNFIFIFIKKYYYVFSKRELINTLVYKIYTHICIHIHLKILNIIILWISEYILQHLNICTKYDSLEY